MVFGQWANFFGPLSEKFRRGSWNCILRVHRNILQKNIFFRKKIFFFYLVRTLRKKFLTFCWEIFEEVERTPSYRSLGTIQGGILILKLLVFLSVSDIEQKFFELHRNVFVGFVTSASYMSLGIDEKRMYFCETFIFSDRLLTVSGNCSSFCRKTVFRVLKTASYVSTATFQGKQNFL